MFAEIQEAIAEVRAFVADYDPEIVVAFGPDHFNGVLYTMMPAFAIVPRPSASGTTARSRGLSRSTRRRLGSCTR